MNRNTTIRYTVGISGKTAVAIWLVALAVGFWLGVTS